MNSLRRFISDWFAYSRGERRASVILIVLTVLVLALRFLIPGKGLEIEVSRVAPPSASYVKKTAVQPKTDSVVLFVFDPNTATFGDFNSLGIPGKVASTLIRYRNSGGIFRKPEDILKVYGMDSLLAKSLIPYINIPGNDTVSGRKHAAPVVTWLNSPLAGELVEINRCDSSDLIKLPGIGPVLSVRIIKYRELLGGYVTVTQLHEVYGIPDSVYNIISALVSIDSTNIRQININSAGFRELDRHPYLERYDVQAIIKYREIKGRIDGISELKANNILNGEKAARIFPYLLFN